MADMVCRKTTWLVPMLRAGYHGTDGPINNQKVHNGYIFFFSFCQSVWHKKKRSSSSRKSKKKNIKKKKQSII